MRLNPDKLDVWYVELTEVLLTPEALLTLSDSERVQAAKFRFERDRARYLRSHIVLRQLLSWYLHCEADQLRFVIGSRGKPSVWQADGDSPVSFSLSHSADLALIAVARGGKVGIDVERVSCEFEWRPVAELLFTDREMNSIEALLEKERAETFFAFWVCKEAFLKATCDGLARATAPTGIVPRGKRRISFSGSSWTLECFVPTPGYVGASCMQGESCELNIRKWCGERENRPIQ
jgi:4'-phosphopantetheinyl transferase